MPFAGWEMPIRYGEGIIEETRAARTGAGLFDVSHMGRLDVSGVDAAALLSAVLSVDARRLRRGRARYNVICDERGGIIDDCIVYRRGAERFLLVPNAANAAAVVAWLARWTPRGADVSVADTTADVAMIAFQGPRAAQTLQRLANDDLSKIRPFRAAPATVNGGTAYLARTGYTGEDGFEIMLPSEDAAALWLALSELGAKPCGLGARDVLRLEAGLLLHGNDMDTSVNPYEAGLGRFVEADREDYVAGAALRAIRDAGAARKLAAFTMVGRGIARRGYAILADGRRIGEVSSGGPSPTLDLNIGLGYVPIAYAKAGARIDIEIRGRPVEAKIATLPFYRRRRSA